MKIKFTKEDRKRLEELNHEKNRLLYQKELQCLDLSAIERLRIRVMAAMDKTDKELESFQIELMELDSKRDYAAAIKYESKPLTK